MYRRAPATAAEVFDDTSCRESAKKTRKKADEGVPGLSRGSPARDHAVLGFEKKERLIAGAVGMKNK